MYYTYSLKQEIAANCEKYIRAKDTQVCLLIFHKNSNYFNLSFFSHSYLNQPIATKCFTWHTRDSYAVVACAKLNYDKIKFYNIPHVTENRLWTGPQVIKTTKFEESRSTL